MILRRTSIFCDSGQTAVCVADARRKRRHGSARRHPNDPAT